MLALCITHLNRFDMLKECLAQVLDDPRVEEIVIQDDYSEMACWMQTEEYFSQFPKVRLFRNTHNVGVYQNKARAIRNATKPWCILFDSDNGMEKNYLDRLEQLMPWDRELSYLPDFAKPTFDY